MSGKEIYEKMQALQEARIDSIDVTTCVYTKATKEIDAQIKELQNQCDHKFKDGAIALTPYGTCMFCEKKI